MGANSTPSRVFKQKHMPGQYGHERVTVQNLEVVAWMRRAARCSSKAPSPARRAASSPSATASSPNKENNRNA